MLLEIRQQKNGTVVVRAPDDTVYTFELDGDKEPPETILQKIGRTLLEILDDPEMPAAVVTGSGVSQGGEYDSGRVEDNVRRTMDSVVPGASRILDFLQGMSGDGEGGDDKEKTG